MAEKIETIKHQPASTVAASDDTLRKFDERFRATLEDFQRAGNQQKAGEDLHDSFDELNGQLEDFQNTSNQQMLEDLQNLLLRIDHHLDYETTERSAIYHRLVAIEGGVKKRGSRGFVRYLLAICIGVAATLAWQFYGEATKQIIATRAPELGWSPETKQMIASWVEQLGWTKLPAGPGISAVQSSVPETLQAAPVAQTAPAAVAPSAPAAPSIDSEQLHQIAVDLGGLRQIVERLTAGQDQMGREVDRLQGAVAEILVKIPEPPPPLPIAAPTRKPKSIAPSSSRAPTPLQLPPHP